MFLDFCSNGLVGTRTPLVTTFADMLMKQYGAAARGKMRGLGKLAGLS